MVYDIQLETGIYLVYCIYIQKYVWNITLTRHLAKKSSVTSSRTSTIYSKLLFYDSTLQVRLAGGGQTSDNSSSDCQSVHAVTVTLIWNPYSIVCTTYVWYIPVIYHVEGYTRHIPDISTSYTIMPKSIYLLFSMHVSFWLLLHIGILKFSTKKDFPFWCYSAENISMEYTWHMFGFDWYISFIFAFQI